MSRDPTPRSSALFAVLALASAVAGCAGPTYRYEHPTKAPAEYDDDWSVCRAITDATSFSLVGWIARAFQPPPMDRCLRTLGWRRESSGVGKEVDEVPPTVVYTTACTVLRFGPDESRAVKARVDPGHRFVEKRRLRGWVRVEDDGHDGWVRAEHLGPEDPKLPPCPASESQTP